MASKAVLGRGVARLVIVHDRGTTADFSRIGRVERA
jgi:hypothetical protein